MSVVKDLGAVSAYALAVKYGYVGTEEEWVKEQEAKRKQAVEAAASAATNAATASTAASTAKTAAESTAADKEAAAQSAAEAETHAKNAAAIAGADIATQDTAGFMKGGANHVTEDGTLELTRTTTDRMILNTCAGGVKINEVRGGSVQESTTGAQLYNAELYSGASATVDKDGWCTVNYDNTEGTTMAYRNISVPVSDLLIPNTEYLIVAEIESISNAVLQATSSATTSMKGQFTETKQYSSIGTKVAIVKTRESFDDCVTMTRTYVGINAGAIGSIKFRISVLADTTIAADTFKYEKFTGGAPSPSMGRVFVSKNLLDITAGNQTFVDTNMNEMEMIIGEDNSIWLDGTTDETIHHLLGIVTLEPGLYYFSSKNVCDLYSLYLTEPNSGTIWLNDVGEVSFTLIEKVEVSCYLYVRSGTDMSGTSEEALYPMIARESGAEYEPYAVPIYEAGYPQEIKGVEGKNLLDCRGLVKLTNNGITFMPVYDSSNNLLYIEANGVHNGDSVASYNLAFQTFDKQKYILSGCPSGGGASTYYLQYNYAHNDVGKGVSVTGIEKSTNVRIVVSKGVTVSNLRFYPMIRPASILDGTYVPYGLLEIKTVGKNLLTIDQYASGTKPTVLPTGFRITCVSAGIYQWGRFYVINGKQLKGHTAIRISAVVTPSANNNGRVRYRWYKQDGSEATDVRDKPSTPIEIPTEAIENNWTFGIIIYSNFNGNAVAGDYVDYTDFIVTLCDDITYEPYQESIITLSQPIKLNGIGDVKDRIVRKGGVWGIERKFAEVVFDGSDDENWTLQKGENNFFEIFVDSLKYHAKLLCNIAIENVIAVYNSNVGIYAVENSKLRFRYELNNALTLDDLRMILKNSPMKLLYQLSSPTYEPLPTADQIALHSLLSYNGATHLYVESGIESEIEVEVGTSVVGGYALDAWNTARRNEIALADLTSAVLALNQE